MSVIKKSRLLAVILTVSLLLSLLDPAAHAKEEIASDPETETDTQTEIIADEEIFSFTAPEDTELSPDVVRQEISEPIPSPFDTAALEIKDDTIVDELPEFRDAAEKRFRMNDGSNVSAVYAYPIHEKDDRGVWQEIDNRLTEEKDERGNLLYARRGLHDTVRFFSLPRDGEIYSVESREGSFRWGFADAKEARRAAAFTSVSAPEGYDRLVPKSAGEHLSYPEILPFIHADYRLIGQTLKENIVLESERALANLEEGLLFRLDTEGYVPVQKDEQTIALIAASGEECYQITASFMMDAGGACSEDLSFTLNPQEDGSFIVELKLNEEWLRSEERRFPVTVDPSLVYMIGGYGGIEASSVYSANPNATERYNLSIGRNYGQENIRALFKLNALPALTEADTVIDARISFVAWFYSAFASNHIGPVTVNLHPLTEDLTISTATWNTLEGKYSTVAADSETVAATDISSTVHPRVIWDITKTVKDWYLKNNNYGMAMISENESSSSIRYIMIHSAIGSTDETILPAFTLTYLNQEGLEGYLTYHSAGSDTMGTLSVGDFNGNLVYTYTDLSMSGAYLPITLAHVYNGSQKANASTVNSSMHFGKGMRLSVSMQVQASSISGYPYKYTDADGTVHYFQLVSGTSGAAGSVYAKEFDTNTKLTKTPSGYTLNDGGTLTYTFNSGGLLTKITDITNGKSQTFTYSGSKLTKITDGAGRSAALAYNSSGYLTSVTDPAGRATSYTYDSNGCLSAITRPDGSTVKLTYVSKDGGYLLGKVTDIDSTSVGVTYYDYAPYRVRQLLEFSSGNAQGRRLVWTYDPGETTVTDRQGRSETMLFDNSGHTVCIRDGAGNAVYGNYNNSNDSKKHALIYSSSLQGSVTNYLTNHDFENTALTWGKYNSSNTEGSFTIDTATVREGSQSLKLVSTGNSASYGIYQTVTVPGAAGKTLTLSAYINYTDYTPTSSGGFRLNIRYKNAAGSWTNIYSKPMPKVSGWHRVSWTGTVPSDASSDSVQAALVFYCQTGTCYIDSAQLEEGAVSNRYNLLENGHVKDSAGAAKPAGWTGTGLESTDKAVSGGRSTNGYQLSGNSQTSKGIYQTVSVKNGKSGDSYVFGAWAKADAIAKAGLYKNNNRYFAVRIRFVKSDGTYTESYYTFEAKTSNWQYLSGTATASAAYVSVQLAVFYSYQKNTAVFDDLCLFRERYGDRYTYDSEGRLTQVTDQAGLKTTYSYLASGRPEISKITYPDGTVTNFTYSTANHRLTGVTDSSGKLVNYTYDSNGNAVSAAVTVNGKTLSSSVNVYSGSYVSSTTDTFGNTTAFNYIQSKGTLSTLTNAKSVATSYTYNANNDYLTKVQTGSSYVSYAYSGGKLSSLTHNTTADSSGNVAYSLQHNAFGTQTEIKVGAQSLVSYTYGSNNGDLTKTAYGNGQYLTPAYDSLGRISKLSYNGTAVYEYYYGTNGKLGLEKDLARGISRRYEYDQAGRITTVTDSNGERHYYTYSSSTGELTYSLTCNAQGTSTYPKSYTYGNYNGTTGERMLSEITLHHNRVKVQYSYDDFYRANKTVLLNTGYSTNTAYTWRAGSGSDQTSYLPSGQTETVKDADGNIISSKKLSYTYDALGNIETIAEGSTQRQKYYYDSLNQLIREDNLDLGKTVLYHYDLGGNLTGTEEYACQTGGAVLGEAEVTNSYTYGDANWKDKLTAYNGAAITYDAIGNPVSYYNGYTFTWQKGRQLASASNGTNTVSYTYNSDGYRTSKTVNGITSAYTLEGDKVLYEKNGSAHLWYYYDAAGSPVGMMMGSPNVLYLYKKTCRGM